MQNSANVPLRGKTQHNKQKRDFCSFKKTETRFADERKGMAWHTCGIMGPHDVQHTIRYERAARKFKNRLRTRFFFMSAFYVHQGRFLMTSNPKHMKIWIDIVYFVSRILASTFLCQTRNSIAVRSIALRSWQASVGNEVCNLPSWSIESICKRISFHFISFTIR